MFPADRAFLLAHLMSMVERMSPFQSSQSSALGPIAEVRPCTRARERLLAPHDQQLSEVPMHRVVEAEKQLRQFLAGTGASPLVRPRSD
jgi:hypothetical protein